MEKKISRENLHKKMSYALTAIAENFAKLGLFHNFLFHDFQTTSKLLTKTKLSKDKVLVLESFRKGFVKIDRKASD